MNMLGNLGGWHSPIVTAAIFLHVGWNMAFNFAGLMTLMSVILYLAVKTEDKLA
jgi:dipeptide/tripeptide permease